MTTVLTGPINFVRRGRALLPELGAPAPVTYHRGLVAYVVVLSIAAAALAAGTVRPVADTSTLLIGSAVVFVCSYCVVRMTDGVDTIWTAGVFVHLAMALTFGPTGALCGAVSQALAMALRGHSGAFRAVFNTANIFLANFAAWVVFSHLTHPIPGSNLLAGAAAATLAGAVQCFMNYALLAGVIRIASGGEAHYLDVLRRATASSILYSLGYGWAAYGAVLLHQVAGTVGFTTTLLPVILLQGFLVLLARRIRAQDLEREAHTKERESLLQQAIDASDAERKRIASDLHDGVVQTLAGLAFSLAARGGAAHAEDRQLLEAADTLRSSVTDLRTLMIEIAPPDLATGGVDSALRKLLEPLPARGIEVELEAADATHLPAEKTSLVFRVAQEAIRNVVNHSEATRVVTSLHYTDGVVTLRVDDNGKGFSAADRSRRREEGHVGLHLLNNAVEASHGRLSLDSEPGRGTSLMLQLPC